MLLLGRAGQGEGAAAGCCLAGQGRVRGVRLGGQQARVMRRGAEIYATVCSRTVLVRCPLQCLVHPVTIHLPQPRDLQPFGGPVVAFCNRSFHSFSAECSPITLEPFEDPVVAADGRIYGEHFGAGCLAPHARGHTLSLQATQTLLALPSRQSGGRFTGYFERAFRKGYRPCCVQPSHPVWL